MFRRGGKDKKFKTGDEAVQLLLGEVKRRDPDAEFFSSTIGVSLNWVKEMFTKDRKYVALNRLPDPIVQ